MPTQGTLENARQQGRNGTGWGVPTAEATSLSLKASPLGHSFPSCLGCGEAPGLCSLRDGRRTLPSAPTPSLPLTGLGSSWSLVST